MNQKTFIFVLSFVTLLLAGCTQPTSVKSTTSTTNNGSTIDCSGQLYWTTPGCTGYCQYQPTAAACLGTTTGTTAGTTSGSTTGTTTGGVACTTNVIATCSNYCSVYPSAYNCLPNGTNCNITPTAAGCPGSSTPLKPAWGTHYPGGEPVGSCSEPVAVAGAITSNDTRKATLTGTGQTSGSIEYNPLTASNYLTTSPMLKSVGQAKVFFETDAKLKFRIKVKPQPAAAQTTTMCYNRNMPGTTIPGYTSLKYTVKVYGVSASNSMTFLATLGPYTTGVNSCSAAIDLSYYQQVSPTGVVVAIDQVQANQDCNFSQYNGFTNCTAYRNVRSFDCWSMDFEVAADDTKTFN